jgi:hypothetical protein
MKAECSLETMTSVFESIEFLKTTIKTNKNKPPNNCCANNPKYNESCLCPTNADEKHPQRESYSPSPPSVNVMEA